MNYLTAQSSFKMAGNVTLSQLMAKAAKSNASKRNWYIAGFPYHLCQNIFASDKLLILSEAFL